MTKSDPFELKKNTEDAEWTHFSKEQKTKTDKKESIDKSKNSKKRKLATFEENPNNFGTAEGTQVLDQISKETGDKRKLKTTKNK